MSKNDHSVNTVLDALERRAGARVLEKANGIKLLVMDVDGIHTDGGLIHGSDHAQLKRFQALDGLGMKFLRNASIQLALITGRTSDVVAERAEEIGAVACHQGVHDKGPVFSKLCKTLNVSERHAAFIGDDLIDIPAMRRAGLSITTPDAHPLVVEVADWQTQRRGGYGAVRDIGEVLLHSQDKLRDIYLHYLTCP